MNHKTNDTPPETSPNALYSRRGVAIIAAGAALTLAVPAISFAAPTSDEVRRQRDLERQARQGLQWEKRVRPGSRSANGWPIELEADAVGGRCHPAHTWLRSGLHVGQWCGSNDTAVRGSAHTLRGQTSDSWGCGRALHFRDDRSRRQSPVWDCNRHRLELG